MTWGHYSRLGQRYPVYSWAPQQSGLARALTELACVISAESSCDVECDKAFNILVVFLLLAVAILLVHGGQTANGVSLEPLNDDKLQIP